MLDVLSMDLLATVVVTSFIQSLFGVGVLLFGTPMLLLLGYHFSESLLILLPISASINLLQILKDYKHINKQIYKNILTITVPFIVIFLFFVADYDVDVSTFIGGFLMFIALKDRVKVFSSFLNTMMKFEKIYYAMMGIIHGMTNLGGALLTTKVFHTDLDKYEKRATIAVSYMTFALFQIATLFLLDIKYDLKNIVYIVIGLSIYTIVNKLFFHKISNHKYDKLFSIFLLISGVTLVFK